MPEMALHGHRRSRDLLWRRGPAYWKSSVLIVACLCLAPAIVSGQRRTISERDLFKFVWVADPQISPDNGERYMAQPADCE
jgi:hypothetical protein